MRLSIAYFVISVMVGMVFSCSGGQQSATAEQSGLIDSTIPQNGERSLVPAFPSHNCTIAGKALEGNQFWIRESDILIAIAADSTTQDPELGDSHRLLLVYDTKQCSLLSRQVLPVNSSPDFPYYLSEITYNKESQLVGIRGVEHFYCYDVAGRKLLPQLKPVFKTERSASDASSGMIQRLEVWEDYMVGYAQEYGTFVVEMKNKTTPKPILPYAEYELPEGGGYASLFLLPSTGEDVQAIVPQFSLSDNTFLINPLFPQPKKIERTTIKGATNNRFLILREASAGRSPIAVDLVQAKSIDLPSDIAGKPTQEILNWVKANTQN